MWLVKGAPNLMQRLSGLPSAPDVALLDRRKPKTFPWPHTTPPLESKTYIRWCCSDLLRPPRLSGLRKHTCTSDRDAKALECGRMILRIKPHESTLLCFVAVDFPAFRSCRQNQPYLGGSRPLRLRRDPESLRGRFYARR